MSARILFAGDNTSVAERIGDLLDFDGHRLVTATAEENILKRLTTEACDVLLLEADDEERFELMDTVKDMDSSIEIIVLTQGCSHELVAQVMRHGGYDFIQIPDELPFRLKPMVQRALEKRALASQVEEEDASRQSSVFSVDQTESPYRKIAHDVRNMISAIMGYASLIEMKLDEESPLRRYTDQIQERSRLALTSTHELRAVAQNAVQTPEQLDLNRFVQDLEPTFRQVMLEGTTVSLDLDPMPQPVWMDHALLEQVLMVLVSNARDAMAGDGRLTLQTRSIISPSEFMSDGSYVRLAYRMDATEASAPGVVDGGIEIVQDILIEHGGYAEVRDPSDDGSILAAYFPIAEK